MRNTENNTQFHSSAHRFGPAFLVAAALLAIIPYSKLKGCSVTNVFLYLGANESEAQSSTRTNQFLCDANTPYWFRIKWSIHGGGVDSFDVKVRNISGVEIYDKDGIDGSLREWVDDINDNDVGGALTQGMHRIKAKVMLHDGGYDSSWKTSDTSKVAMDADPGDPPETGWLGINPGECPEIGHICPCSSANGYTSTDDCGHVLDVDCVASTCFISCHFEYSYDGTLVGWCPWGSAANGFHYRITTRARWGKKRFIETMHCSFNDSTMPPAGPYKGPDPDNEACTDYYCWRVERYDCLTPAVLAKNWRRTTSADWLEEVDWDETQGEACPGPDPADPTHSKHPGYPG